MASLLVFRRDVATELGPAVFGTTSTASSDLVSFTAATLVNANAGAGQFQGYWAYLNATTGANLAGQGEVLKAGGYDNAAGSITIATSFATSVASGVGFELLTKLPALRDGVGTPGIREALNDTLLSLPPIDLLPVTGVTSQVAYDVTTTYPWLVDKHQIISIRFQYSGDDYPRVTGYSFDWLYDADAPRLLIPGAPFKTGDTFYVEAHRPAQTWIKTGGTWAADTDGLNNDTDEALPLRSVVRAQTLATCYRWLANMPGPDEYRQFYAEREAFWTRKAYSLRWWGDQKNDSIERTSRFSMVYSHGGPYGGSRSYR